MYQKFALIFSLLLIGFTFGQQNEEFVSVKKYFDYQRFMLNNQFKTRFNSESSENTKINIEKDFSEFMKKIDSVQNTALIGTLIKVKNREDLERLQKSNTKIRDENPVKSELSEEARYPGGFENLRDQVSDLFYFDAITNAEYLTTNVNFVVEPDGSISSVHADGDNFVFNRQAEIAIYLLPEKFTPALIKGNAVQYRFRLPLTMKFE